MGWDKAVPQSENVVLRLMIGDQPEGGPLHLEFAGLKTGVVRLRHSGCEAPPHPGFADGSLGVLKLDFLGTNGTVGLAEAFVGNERVEVHGIGREFWAF